MNDLARTQPAAASSAERDGATDGTRIFTGNLFRVRDGRGWAFTEQPPPSPPAEVHRPARVAQTLALAHRLQAAIERGDYRDRAELARQLGFTRARVTQLLDLLLLAPDIQEHVLDLEAVDGVEPMAERALRDIVRHEGWAEQRVKLPHEGGSALGKLARRASLRQTVLTDLGRAIQVEHAAQILGRALPPPYHASDGQRQ